MKSNINLIILNFVLIYFLTSCHTFEHKNIFIKNIKKSENKKVILTEDKGIKNKDKKVILTEDKGVKNKNEEIDKKKTSNKTEMAPIKVPNQKEKVKTFNLNKNINRSKTKKINLNMVKNWSEKKLIKKMGKSDFIKQEGKLKNFQYYFSNCFLDIFLIKKKNGYFVTYIQTRSTKLYGSIESEKCMKEINNKLNKQL